MISDLDLDNLDSFGDKKKKKKKKRKGDVDGILDGADGAGAEGGDENQENQGNKNFLKTNARASFKMNFTSTVFSMSFEIEGFYEVEILSR